MSKEEIMDLLDSTNHLSKVEQALEIWNAAIDASAESADECWCEEIVHKAITDLKFK